MAVLSSTIANQVITRLGMEYNHEQEREADELASKVLGMLGYSPRALSSALSQISNQMTKERQNCMYLSSYTHPALMVRINQIGLCEIPQNILFEKKVSFAISATAIAKYEDRRFRQALELVDINITNNVAVSSDFLIKAKCYLSLFNDDLHNNEILNIIEKAKAIDTQTLDIYKTEILAYLRLNDIDKAKTLLQEYTNKITHLIEINNKNINQELLLELHKYYLSEQCWASDMLIKLNGF